MKFISLRLLLLVDVLVVIAAELLVAEVVVVFGAQLRKTNVPLKTCLVHLPGQQKNLVNLVSSVAGVGPQQV